MGRRVPSHICPTCRAPKKEHPYDRDGIFCDLVLVRDRRHTDGSGDVVTVEVDPDDGQVVTHRTRENNLRWVQRSSLAR